MEGKGKILKSLCGWVTETKIVEGNRQEMSGKTVGEVWQKFELNGILDSLCNNVFPLTHPVCV